MDAGSYEIEAERHSDRSVIYPIEDESIEVCLSCGGVLGSEGCERAHDGQ